MIKDSITPAQAGENYCDGKSAALNRRLLWLTLA